jgi:hypothetical protein
MYAEKYWFELKLPKLFWDIPVPPAPKPPSPEFFVKIIAEGDLLLLTKSLKKKLA